MPKGRPKKIAPVEQPPIDNAHVAPGAEQFYESENLTPEIIASNLCAGCGRELNEPQITNEKGSYHGVACYNKVN